MKFMRTTITGQRHLDWICLPTARGLESVASADIIRIEAISNYSKLYFSNGKTLVVAKVLKWFEARLSEEPFARVHRTHLVNLACIQSYVRGDKSRLVLYNGDKIEVARSKRKTFLHHWKTVA
jgi:two-component system, LytTR family, response regulator